MTTQKIVKGQVKWDENDETNEPEQMITDIEAVKLWKLHLNMHSKKNLDIDFQVVRNVKRLKSEISYKNSQEQVQTRMEDYYYVNVLSEWI